MNDNNLSNQKTDTKHRILDSAEELFAREGFHATSLRAVTGKAGVNLAAVNYHFGSKEALLKAVLERRLLPLNRVRKENLEKVTDSAKQQGKKPLVKDLISAFATPTLDFVKSTPDAKHFVSLVARAFLDPDDTVRRLFTEMVMPLFQVIFESFREALPDLPENILLWRLYFMFGAFSHAMHISSREIHSGPVKFPSGRDAQTIVEIFTPFITAGMESPWRS